MKKKVLSVILIFLTFFLLSCSLSGDGEGAETQEDELLEEASETYTAELLSEGFEFCPDSYLEIEIEQSHEIAQFSFTNYVNASGQLPMEIFERNEKRGLRTKGDIELLGEGWAGICQFKSSGLISFELKARLFPGDSETANLLIYGQSESSLTTKPPCGDFGMMPLEKAVHVVIPYRDGGTIEWDWKNRSAGVYGKSIWTLHIPCEQ